MNNLSQLDIINVMSFLISLENLEANLTQSDKQDLQSDLSSKAEIILKEIHTHLQKQDEKLDRILKKLDS